METDYREQKGGGQPEQNAVQRLQGTHQLPVRIQKYICMTISRYGTERVEYGRIEIGRASCRERV